LNRRRTSDRHLPPCVYFKHGAYWLVKKGKWTRLGEDLAESLVEYAKTVEKPKGGMAELIEKVYRHHCAGLADNTKQQYRVAADRLSEIFKNFTPPQVKSKHIAAMKVSMAATPNMCNRLLSFLRVVFAYAVEWQLVDSNPVVGIKRHKEARRDRLLSDAEWSAIHEKAGPRLRVIMELQYLTGQRIGDVLAIRRNQITDAGIEFQQEKTDAKLIVRWSRQLRATVTAAEALSAGKPPALTLLRGRYNGAPDYKSVYDQFKVAALAAGVSDASVNDGRAKSATTTRAQGKDAQALLGHTSPAMTARYLRDRLATEVRGPNIRQALDVGRKVK
jgi:integrase